MSKVEEVYGTSPLALVNAKFCACFALTGQAESV